MMDRLNKPAFLGRIDDVEHAIRGRLREGAESYAKALASDILR